MTIINGKGVWGNGKGNTSDYNPVPYPFTRFIDKFPLVNTPALATPLASTLVHMSQNEIPAASDLPPALNAYSASLQSKAWAYFHPVVADLPTEKEVLQAQAEATLAKEAIAKGRTRTVRKRKAAGWSPDELVLPAAVAQDLARGEWAPLAACPDRGGRARYRLLVFIHRHRSVKAGRPRKEKRPDEGSVYTMSVWDREVGELTHYDFQTAGRESRQAAAKLWWSMLWTRFDEAWCPGDSSWKMPALLLPNWMDIFVDEPPVFSALAELQACVPGLPFDPATSIYGVMGACLELVNAIDSPNRLGVTDDAEVVTAMDSALMPALFECLFLLLRAQPTVLLGAGMANNLHVGNQWHGRMFHSIPWINNNLAVAREGSIFRNRLCEQLGKHVPLVLDRGTVQVLTRRNLGEIATQDRYGKCYSVGENEK